MFSNSLSGLQFFLPFKVGPFKRSTSRREQKKQQAKPSKPLIQKILQEKAMVMNFSSPECVTWLTLGVTESAVVMAGNLTTIIVFMKNNYLRKRSLYLVINLTVADMLAGGIFIAQIFFSLDSHCKFSKFNLGSYRRAVPLYFAIYFLIYLFPLTSLTDIAMICLQQAHATFRPFKHRVIK